MHQGGTKDTGTLEKCPAIKSFSPRVPCVNLLIVLQCQQVFLKGQKNESDDETSTVSNKDIFSSPDDDKSSEETDDDSNEGESSEQTNDSDEEADPWRALIDEATAELHTKHSELVQSFKNEGFSEIDAKKQAFVAILPELRKELGNVYMDRLQWMTQL